ncbi:hypothetical protein, partial [uncultured Thiodictyon sp.]|uniref:hypothetical protein n=1 Tax=uncultured Thiodictyon sp. TaxID=1846217 RepID=UPI0025F90DED
QFQSTPGEFAGRCEMHPRNRAQSDRVSIHARRIRRAMHDSIVFLPGCDPGFNPRPANSPGDAPDVG